MTEPFWQMSLAAWTADRVREFLAEGVREGDHVEYKEARTRPGSDRWMVSDDVLETVCAMANAADGIIFVGVRADPNGYPLEVTGLVHTSPEKAIRDRCASDIEPGVYLDSAVVTMPGEDDAARKSVLIIRVRRGGNPPYVLRDRGAFVRNDEHDRPARRADLDALYSRRQIEQGESVSPWTAVLNDISLSSQASLDVPWPVVAVGLSPAFPATDVVLGRQQDLEFRSICSDLFRLDFQPVLDVRSVGMRPDEGWSEEFQRSRAQAWPDGTFEAQSFYTGSSTVESGLRQIGIVGLWKVLRRMLTTAERWPRNVCASGGTLLYAIALGNIAGAIPVLPPNESFRHLTSLDRIPPTHVNRREAWWARGEWQLGEEVDDLIQRDLLLLARQLQCSWWEEMADEVRHWSRE